MLFMFIAFDRKDGGSAIRAKVRPRHVDYTKSRGMVKFGGPFVGPDGGMVGSFSIIEAQSYDEALAYTKADPYAEANLFERTELHPWVLSINKLDPV